MRRALAGGLLVEDEAEVAQSGEWDDQLLERLLADLSASPEIDLTLTGFSADELSKLMQSLETREKKDRPESFDLDAALEAATRAPRAQRGDTWLLGHHRLGCGDSTDSADVSRLMAGARAALAFTDPPYNVDLGNHGGQQRGALLHVGRRYDLQALAVGDLDGRQRRRAALRARRAQPRLVVHAQPHAHVLPQQEISWSYALE